MSTLLSLSLYHTSFLPLWISILFMDIKSIVEKGPHLTTEIVGLLCIVISLPICIFIIFIALHTKIREGTILQTLVSVKEEKRIIAEYLLAYILPFFAFDFTRWDQVIPFLIFYLTLGFLCVRHNYLSVNILLEIAGFRLYRCSLKNDDGIVTDQIVISHRRLNSFVGESLYLSSLNNEYKLDTRLK